MTTDRLDSARQFAIKLASLMPSVEPRPSLLRRFLKFIEKSDGCWTWKGARRGPGYGMFYLNSKRQYAHRVSYILHYGEIPDRLCVCHHCDNPICVRPDHLFLGSHQENMADRDRKGRNRRGSNKVRLKHKKATSQYTGVSWCSSHNKWRADITIDRKHIFLGRHCAEIDAARAYNHAALEHFGEFARLNDIPE